MRLADYGKGKPLTARRILAVSAAVTAEVAKLDQAKSAALSDGFTKTEVETMSKVAGFYSEATGCTRLEAFQEVAKAGTNANRLLNYGGRFLESADNFRNGLRLLDSFKSWFTGVGDALQANGGAQGDRKEGMSKTLLSADVATFSSVRLRGVEKFVFELIAHDPSFDLAETDENKLFGMENNPATHFIGRSLYKACAQTVATDPVVARDQYARFVTKGRKTSSAALTPAERNKANFAMVITTKGSGTVLNASFGVLLDSQKNNPKMRFAIPQPFRLRLNTVPGLVADLK